CSACVDLTKAYVALLTSPFFFFQAEDGIRDGHVTGVQTCALPILLFVIVKRPSGPPRPLAAVRIDHPKFPQPFEVTNADVMLQGSELKGVVAVIARLDKDGNAGPAQPGDIEGEYAKNPTMVGAKNVEIVLNTVK